MSAMTEKQAADLWDGLRSNLLAVEDNIKQIIATRAWEPLGFDSFAECWEARLSDVKLTRELRAVVVFAMFEDDATPADAARAVSGVGVVEVRSLESAFNRGMDARDAAYITRPRARQRRGIPGQTISVNINLNEDEHAQLAAAAAFEGCSMKEFARVAVLRYIDGMRGVA